MLCIHTRYNLFLQQVVPFSTLQEQLLDSNQPVWKWLPPASTHWFCYCAQYSDLHANDKGDVLVEAQKGPLQLGLWVNTHKNPRFKTINFKELGVSIDVPKQLALANVALRLQVGLSSKLLLVHWDATWWDSAPLIIDGISVHDQIIAGAQLYLPCACVANTNSMSYQYHITQSK